jgi:hypothetical protein
MNPVLLHSLLADVKRHGLAGGRFAGLLHVLIARRVTLGDGTVVSAGLTWRQAAAALEAAGWDRGRDSWFAAIRRADVGSPAAWAEAEHLAGALARLGYVVSAGPGG